MRTLPAAWTPEGEPEAYARARRAGRRQLVAAPVAMDERSALKVAWWRGSVRPERTPPSKDFVSLFLHLDGGPVHRADGMTERSEPGALLAPALLEASAWESEGEFDWCQFYLSRGLVDEIAEERFGRPLARLDRDRSALARDGDVARLAWRARNELFAAPPSALALDAWAVLLAERWLRDWAPAAAEREGEAVDAPEPEGEAVAAPDQRPRAVRHAIDYLEAHLNQNVTLQEMAEAAGVSRFHLVRLFRSSVGETPAAFARARRLQRAGELLRSSDLPISKIALACGFADQSHFTSAFRRAEGMTPARYRQLG